MKKILLIAAATVFVASTGNAQPLPKEGPELFAGYPLCMDFYKEKMLANLELLGATVADNAEAELALSELALAKKKPPRQPLLGDAPEHPTTHPRKKSKLDPCFVGETPVVRLVFDGKHFSEETTIYEIDSGDYVLASLASHTTSEHFQKACWAEVMAVSAGLVYRDEKIHLITYYSESKSITVQSTPSHRFLVQEEDGSWSWMPAETLARMSSLRTCKGENCSVYSNEIIFGGEEPSNAVEEFFDWLGWYSTWTYVYNLKTDISTYYVGPQDAQVLVHNTY